MGVAGEGRDSGCMAPVGGLLSNWFPNARCQGQAKGDGSTCCKPGATNILFGYSVSSPRLPIPTDKAAHSSSSIVNPTPLTVLHIIFSLTLTSYLGHMGPLIRPICAPQFPLLSLNLQHLSYLEITFHSSHLCRNRSYL